MSRRPRFFRAWYAKIVARWFGTGVTLAALLATGIALLACSKAQAFEEWAPRIGVADFSFQPPEKWAQLPSPKSNDGFTVLFAYSNPQHPMSNIGIGKLSGEYGKLYDIVEAAISRPEAFVDAYVGGLKKGISSIHNVRVTHAGGNAIDGRKAFFMEMQFNTDRNVGKVTTYVVSGNNHEYYFLHVMAAADDYPAAVKVFRHSVESVRIADPRTGKPIFAAPRQQHRPEGAIVADRF